MPGGNGGNGSAGGNGSGGSGGTGIGHGGEGGNGGKGGGGGAGNNGGGGNIAAAGASFTSAEVGGGDGGNGGDNDPGGTGGNGGSAAINVHNSSIGALSIQGGNGGNGGGGSHGGGKGGNGGDASANLTSSSVGAIFMQSGQAGSSSLDGTSGGAGGSVFLKANTLRTGGLDLIKNDGALSLAIDKALVWTGSGAFTLTGNGASISIGSLTIDGGTVNASNYGNLISANAFYTDKAITLGNGGATFDTSGGAQNVGRALTGTGSLTKTGAGTLTLSGNNAYTGTTTIKAGTLALSGAGTLGASPLLDLRGGDLDISGVTPASLSLPDLDVRGASRLNIGDRTADFSGKTLSFYVPSDMGAGGTLLSVSGAGATNIGNSTVRVGIAGSSSLLGRGDAVTLIDAAGGALQGDPANTSSTGEGMQGVTLRYQFDIAKSGNRLTATVARTPQTDSGAKALSEGWLSGMALANMGSDLAAGAALDNARQATAGMARGNGGSSYGLAAFGALSGGASRYNTGSHVDVSGVSALVGMARRFDAAPGSFLTGAFFEYGYGHSSTHNGFDDRSAVDGNGQSSYYGGGLLARFDVTTSPLAGLYAEGSFRLGRLSTDWHSDDLRDALGRRADYDSSVPYYGAHAGLGYIWDLSEKTSLDVYGKYFWTRVKGDSVRLSTGDPVDFKATDSQRLRAGARFTKVLDGRVVPYLGAAWEHEFDGRARATAWTCPRPPSRATAACSSWA